MKVRNYQKVIFTEYMEVRNYQNVIFTEYMKVTNYQNVTFRLMWIVASIMSELEKDTFVE